MFQDIHFGDMASLNLYYIHISISYTRWCHEMETFSALLLFVWGIHQSPVNSPHGGQWHGALMFSLICAWTNGGYVSGLLFRKYMADLSEYLYTEFGICLGDSIVAHLLWANGLILLSDSLNGLQKQLNGLFRFCNDNMMIVNEIKTEVMVYGPANKNFVTPVEHRRCPECNVIEKNHSFYLNAPLIQMKGWNLTKFGIWIHTSMPCIRKINVFI